MITCPNCGSERTRRGGHTIWTVYLVLIALGVFAVLLLKLNAAIIAGIMIAIVVISHLVVGERLCRECGHHWRG